MKKLVLYCVLNVLVFVFVPNAFSVKVAGIGDPGGYIPTYAADVIFGSGDLSGSINRLDHSTFNSMSVADLSSDYDVLLFSWSAGPTLNTDWNTRLLPYLNAGGGIIWEDPSNLSDLNPIVTGYSTGFNQGTYAVAPVAGLTDGFTNYVHHDHFRVTSWDSSLNPLITDGAEVTALYGTIGNGRIVINGTDGDFHGERDTPGWRSNHYNMLKSEIEWTSSSVAVAPEPSASVLFAAGLITLGFIVRRKIKN